MKTHCDKCNQNFKDEAGLAMHTAAKHTSNVNQSKKSKAIWVYLGLAIFVGVILIILYTQYLGGAYTPNSNTAGSSSSSGELQKVVIGMQNSNYYPNTISVKAGQPVEITLDSSVGGCYRSFNIPQFGVSKYSQSTSDKIIFTPTEKGTFQFKCGMGMGRGTLIVE